MNNLHTKIWDRMLPEIERVPPKQRKKANELVTMAVSLLCEDSDTHPRGEWDARKVAAARIMGHGCSADRWPMDRMLELLGRTVEETVAIRAASPHTTISQLKALTETCNRFLRELLKGYQETSVAVPSRPTLQEDALALLRGNATNEDARFARAYAVMAFRTLTPSLFTLDALDALERDVLAVLCDYGGYLLVPAGDANSGISRCTRIHTALPDASWAGVSWRKAQQVPDGRTEAVAVVTSALAARRPSGCYFLEDVPVEYAILSRPSVAGLLATKIEPVTRNPVLMKTLRALLDADGNRSKAANELIIHRSTLTYRLQRINQLTGYDPASLRELHVLSTALTAHDAATSPPLSLPLSEIGR